jgi:hypothetical protein
LRLRNFPHVGRGAAIVPNQVFYLRSDIHLCLADGHCVFMDLEHDTYCCLSKDDTHALLTYLGYTSSDTARRTQTPPPRPTAIIRALRQRNFLAMTSTDGKALAKALAPLSNEGLQQYVTNSVDRLRLAHVLRFFHATALASLQLKTYSMRRTVAMIKRSKERSGNVVTSATECARLFAVFQRLRPYYPRPYLCLFDSLALVHFLSRFGLFPDWVFGVKVAPFGAHCWVQINDVLVNDIPDNVTSYSPIMRI